MRHLESTQQIRRDGAPAGHGWVEHADDGRCVVALRGEWDLSNSDVLRDLLERVSAAYSSVILDLSQVTFADSTVLSEMVACQARLRAGGGALSLVVAGDPVRLLLDVAGLSELFDIHGTRQAARRSPPFL
jgi:anti-sigma B factor antagonist